MFPFQFASLRDFMSPEMLHLLHSSSLPPTEPALLPPLHPHKHQTPPSPVSKCTPSPHILRLQPRDIFLLPIPDLPTQTLPL
ncbi:hypothetical protein A2U01_0059769, partial [Trifolium medium]|nr:hypothetical protein [Trifolium medium]